MNDRSATITTPLIKAYMNAGDEGTADELLADLFNNVLEPQIRAFVRRKLHVSLLISDDRKENQDALELVSEVKTLILAKLAGLRVDKNVTAIDNLQGYVQAITVNSSNHYLRKKYPNRLRLKNQLRYLLTHDKRFAIWNTQDGEPVCGRSEWQTDSTQALPTLPAEAVESALSARGVTPATGDLIQIVCSVFDSLGNPVRFGALISSIYEFRGVSEPHEVAEAEGYNESTGSHGALQRKLELRDLLGSLWQEINELPLRHRAAILLNLRNSQGDALIALLPLTGVASIQQIATCLEIPAAEFAKLWSELPLDDNTIAERLGLTRQQVINLRQSARATLRRRLSCF